MSNELEQLGRVLERCKDKNYTFLGFAGGAYQGAVTKLNLSCPKHDQWSTTRISDFLRGRGCPSCGRESTTNSLFKNDSTFIDLFEKSGKFLSGTRFWKSERQTPAGEQSYWNYNCPCCSSDEFVKNGLCSGIFEAYSGSLQLGIKACRCSANYAFTEQQQVYRINSLLSTTPDYKFLGWDGSYVGRTTRMQMSCVNHPNWYTNYGDLSKKHGCPACARRGYNPSKDGYLYVLKAVSLGGRGFTGFGISNVPKRRMAEHRKNLSRDGFSIDDYSIFKTDGDEAPEIERRIKQNFKLYSQDISGFVTEATSPEHYLEVRAFIEKHSRRLPSDNI